MSPGLWMVDMQEKTCSCIRELDSLIQRISFVLQYASTLQLPLFVTEQMPQKLGSTLKHLKELLPASQIIYAKTTFSGISDSIISEAALQMSVSTWILMGVETHICVMQTAKALLQQGKQVVILRDCIASYCREEHLSALEELKQAGVRLTTSEAFLYECIQDAHSPRFSQLLPLIKAFRRGVHEV